MPADQPFTPVQASTTGKTVIVLATSSASTNGTVVSGINAIAENLLVTNPNPGVTLFVRMSTEASPTATNADVPIPPNTSHLFGNPSPTGTTGVAVIVASLSQGSNGQQCYAYFTPGNMGIV
jgi:hypothetical protein